MSDNWTITNKAMAGLGEQVDAEITHEGGGPMWIYTVEIVDDDDEPVTRKVIAGDEDELGEKIAAGDFYDD